MKGTTNPDKFRMDSANKNSHRFGKETSATQNRLLNNSAQYEV